MITTSFPRFEAGKRGRIQSYEHLQQISIIIFDMIFFFIVLKSIVKVDGF